MEKISMFDLMEMFNDYDLNDAQYEQLMASYKASKNGNDYNLERFHDNFDNCFYALLEVGLEENKIMEKIPSVMRFYRGNSFRQKLIILDSINETKLVLEAPGVLMNSLQKLYARTRLFREKSDGKCSFLTVSRMNEETLIKKFDLNDEMLNNMYPLNNKIFKMLVQRKKTKDICRKHQRALKEKELVKVR
ncbi:MAG: hypothetical protein RR359_05450 [Bacilli bacterium]